MQRISDRIYAVGLQLELTTGGGCAFVDLLRPLMDMLPPHPLPMLPNDALQLKERCKHQIEEFMLPAATTDAERAELVTLQGHVLQWIDQENYARSTECIPEHMHAALLKLSEDARRSETLAAFQSCVAVCERVMWQQLPMDARAANELLQRLQAAVSDTVGGLSAVDFPAGEVSRMWTIGDCLRARAQLVLHEAPAAAAFHGGVVATGANLSGGEGGTRASGAAMPDDLP